MISPVDPPGKALSQASVAVVDHDRFAILHLLLPVTTFDSPGAIHRRRWPRHHLLVRPPPGTKPYVMPRSRSILPRSKPTITSPSMTVTGVARSPSFSSSSSACGSSRMFFAMNWIPF